MSGKPGCYWKEKLQPEINIMMVVGGIQLRRTYFETVTIPKNK